MPTATPMPRRAGRRGVHPRRPRPRRRPHPPGRGRALDRPRTPPPAADIGDPSSTGVRWGRLLLQERVGAGVYGEVFRAFDESLRRDVAVKLLRASGRSAELLAAKVLNEGRLLARVRHRNVVTVHGVDTHDGRVGLWMEFIRGNTLEQLLERQGPFGGREASLLGQDLCRALAAVHAAGLVHRDVKAQNVIREEGGRLVLMDFGTGLLLEDDEAVKASPVAGTPLYLSPEVLAGADASPQSDIYSLGVLLFHLVTGSYPYVARSLAELRRMQDRGERKRLHDLRPDLSEGFVHVVERALESDPAERYASVGAMQRGLTHALGLESGLMSPVTLAGIADGDAALRGSSTLTASGAVARPAPRASRWQIWLPVAARHRRRRRRRGVGGRATGRRRRRRRPRAAPLGSLVVEPFEVVSTGDKRARRRHRRSGHGAGAAAARRPRRVVHGRAGRPRRGGVDRRRRPGPAPGRRRWCAAPPPGTTAWRASASACCAPASARRCSSRRSSGRSSAPPSCRGSSPARWCAGSACSASSDESSRLARADDAAPAVFEAYLRGRSAMRHLSEPNVARAIEHFNQALAVNRNHAPSLVGLAECYLLQGVTYGSLPRGKATLLAREAIGRALALDGDHAAAVNADAQLRFYLEWDGDGAERAFQRALELSPNADARAPALRDVPGRPRSAWTPRCRRCSRRWRIDPASIAARAALGMVWHYTGNQRQAERTFLEVLAIDGRYSQARKGLVRTLLAGKQYAKVLGLLDGWAQGSTDPQDRFFLAARGVALAGAGQLREARRIADELLASPKADGEVDAASVLVALGDAAQALTLLAAGGGAALGAHPVPAPRRTLRGLRVGCRGSPGCSTAWTSSADPAAPDSARDSPTRIAWPRRSPPRRPPPRQGPQEDRLGQEDRGRDQPHARQARAGQGHRQAQADRRGRRRSAVVRARSRHHVAARRA